MRRDVMLCERLRQGRAARPVGMDRQACELFVPHLVAAPAAAEAKPHRVAAAAKRRAVPAV
jgi:hypothetical protein